MIRKRLGRVATVFTAGSMAMLLLGVGTVSAAQPGWKFENLKYLPATVADGQLAGWSFTIANRGKSNISQLYLTDTVNAAPEYFSATRAGCVTSPNLFCSFGALNPGQTINVKIAYRVGTANFTNQFRLDSTGDPAGGNNSHGDSLPLNVTTTVSTSADYDGGFTLDDATYQTTGTLGRQNKQSTIVQTTDNLIPVTVEDGVANFACANTDPDCNTSFIGEWSVLNVNDGATGALIKVTIMIWGGSVPGGVTEDEIFLLHADGFGGATPITADCNSDTAPTNADCIVDVQKIGNNFRIIAWLTKNGGLRGIY